MTHELRRVLITSHIYTEHAPDFVDFVDTLQSLSTPAEVLRFLHRRVRKTADITAVSFSQPSPSFSLIHQSLLACETMRSLGSE